jgi:hypothetical protein
MLHSLASNIFTITHISSLVPNTLYLLCSFFIIEANSVSLVDIISCKTSGCCCCYYYYYCCYCYCCYCYYYYYCCAFAYNLFCRDDCDKNLVFDGVKGCRELVDIVDREELEEGVRIFKRLYRRFFFVGRTRAGFGLVFSMTIPSSSFYYKVFFSSNSNVV